MSRASLRLEDQHVAALPAVRGCLVDDGSGVEARLRSGPTGVVDEDGDRKAGRLRGIDGQPVEGTDRHWRRGRGGGGRRGRGRRRAGRRRGRTSARGPRREQATGRRPPRARRRTRPGRRAGRPGVRRRRCDDIEPFADAAVDRPHLTSPEGTSPLSHPLSMGRPTPEGATSSRGRRRPPAPAP